MSDKKEDIIRLQSEIIRELTEKNLRSVGDDLWKASEEPTPPPGFPPIPDVFGEEEKPKAAEPARVKAPEKKEEEAPPRERIEDLKKELNAYIGLDLIKNEVDSLINLVRIDQKRREHDLPTEDLSLHMVFSGNPGTGKTMIARLMSRIYHSLGILSKGHLVEVDRSQLVAGFVGQTAIKTQDVIKKAMGGVLFIDEAYTLSRAQGNDYGQEAIDTILKAMEDHRDDLIVIVAGYVDLMNGFIHSNPGLESRFNRFLYFPDYTVDEMLAIFHMRCKKAGYVLDRKAETLLKTILKEESGHSISFGNARGVRNLFEKAVARQANRLAKDPDLTREELMLLTKEDLEDAETEQAPRIDSKDIPHKEKLPIRARR